MSDVGRSGLIGGRPRRALVSAVAAFILAILSIGVVSAHIGIEPAASPAGTSQRFSVRVPTEKNTPTVKVRVEFPAGVTVSRFQPKPGWQRTVEKDPQGRMTSVTWSGGRILPDEFDEFEFIARNPADSGTLAWKTYQTYEDGSTVEWTGAEGSDRPAPVTSVGPAGSAATDEHAAAAIVASEDASPQLTGGVALVLGGSVLLALLALVLAIHALRRPRGSSPIPETGGAGRPGL